MDYVGVNWASMFCSVFVFVGSMASALGSNFDSFKLILGGRVIMGLGSVRKSKFLQHSTCLINYFLRQ